MPYFAREAKSNIIYHSNRITPENGLKNAKIMTIQEIRDLIAKKIAGQGTQVDVGGGLAAILNGTLDAVGNFLDSVLVINENLTQGVVEISSQRFAELLHFGIVSYDGALYPVSGSKEVSDDFSQELISRGYQPEGVMVYLGTASYTESELVVARGLVVFSQGVHRYLGYLNL